MKVVELKTAAACEAALVRSDVDTLSVYVKERDCVGIAVAIVHADGTSAVQTRGKGCRTQLLGAVTDLQYSIAKDGDMY